MDQDPNVEPQIFMKHDTRLHGGSGNQEVMTSEYLRKFIIYEGACVCGCGCVHVCGCGCMGWVGEGVLKTDSSLLKAPPTKKL